MRRILAQDSTFLQRLHHQRDISLLKIPHAAVYQFRAAAGRAFSEIALLQQQHLIAARGRIHGDARARRAPSNNDNVPLVRLRMDAAQHFRSVHVSTVSRLGCTNHQVPVPATGTPGD